MKINKCLVGWFVGVALCVALVSAQEDGGETRPEGRETGDRGRGFFNFILDPLKSTIRSAKNLIGNPVNRASDGVDMVRLQTYKMFMSLYNKTYSPDEIPRRMALFFERRKQIEESVKMFQEGKSLFVMRENDFTDWDEDELKKLTGVSLPDTSELEPEELNVEPVVESSNSIDDHNADKESSLVVGADSVPATMDWRESGCVSTPINQLKCGACYAIATMSVVESMRCLNQVTSPTLSPQQIVDCATSRAGYANYGCDGGWPTRVFKYLQDVGVASRETCYPFVRRQNTCKLRQMKETSGCTVAASPTNSRLQYKILNNERDIQYHVANTGPVVTVMKASDKFLYYGKGIFDDPRCSRRRDDVDHAIVIVGYGRESGVDYWIIKNSWGTTSWGEGGYGKFRRGKFACSIGHWGWVVTS